MTSERLELARDAYRAYESQNRESRKTGGRRFRNTEVLTFLGDQICKVEVYFGWDL